MTENNMINIAGLTPVNDPSYRYKMPCIVSKVEGRGNGIKTVIVNVSEIATALNRDACEITKFFGCEFGEQTTMSLAGDRYVVSGAHSLGDLKKMMSKYIENFVICKQCRLPETYYKFKNKIIYQKCMACGSKNVCDTTHKFMTAIILRNFKNFEKPKNSEKNKKKRGDDEDDEKEKEEKKEQG